MNQLNDFVRRHNNNKIYFIKDNNNANWKSLLFDKSIKKIEFKLRIYFLYFLIQTVFCLFIAIYR